MSDFLIMEQETFCNVLRELKPKIFQCGYWKKTEDEVGKMLARHMKAFLKRKSPSFLMLNEQVKSFMFNLSRELNCEIQWRHDGKWHHVEKPYGEEIKRTISIVSAKNDATIVIEEKSAEEQLAESELLEMLCDKNNSFPGMKCCDINCTKAK